MKLYLCRAAWYLGHSKNICAAANNTRGFRENLEFIHRNCDWVIVHEIEEM